MLITQENFKTRKKFVKAYYESMYGRGYIKKCIDDGSFIKKPNFDQYTNGTDVGYNNRFTYVFDIHRNKTLTNLGLENANNYYLFDAILKGPLKYRYTEEEYVIDEVKEKYINHLKHTIRLKIGRAGRKRYSFGHAIDAILDELKDNAVFILSDNTRKYKSFLNWRIGTFNGLGNFELIGNPDDGVFANLLGYKIPCIVPKKQLWDCNMIWCDGFYDYSGYEPFLVILDKDRPIEEVSYWFTEYKFLNN
jgi:hypothetical protein